MQVIGHDIGDVLDGLYAQIERRVRVEAERELRVEAFEGGGTSNVRWEEDAVVVQLHSGVPTHALPQVFGVALQHVRQRVDFYPDIRRPPGDQPEGSHLVRHVLRELVLAPEAAMQLKPLDLDQQWEAEQRHQGLKEMLRDATDDWDEAGTIGNYFAAMQYAHFSIQHPAEMWEGLRETMRKQLPGACERGDQALEIVRRYGWGSPGACLESLVGVRNELKLSGLALVEDRRSNELL